MLRFSWILPGGRPGFCINKRIHDQQKGKRDVVRLSPSLIPPARGGKTQLLPLDGGGRVRVKVVADHIVNGSLTKGYEVCLMSQSIWHSPPV